jgi:hypothetical protein
MRANFALTVWIFFACAMFAVPAATAATLCDTVPGSAVAAAIGAPRALKPEVNDNGCTYRTGPGEQLKVSAIVEEDTGPVKASFDSVLQSIMFDKLPGVGAVAATHSRQIGKQWDQMVQFRAKGKIVTLIVTSYASALPNATLAKLGALFFSKL